jgi:hypothetical protein
MRSVAVANLYEIVPIYHDRPQQCVVAWWTLLICFPGLVGLLYARIAPSVRPFVRAERFSYGLA